MRKIHEDGAEVTYPIELPTLSDLKLGGKSASATIIRKVY